MLIYLKRRQRYAGRKSDKEIAENQRQSAELKEMRRTQNQEEIGKNPEKAKHLPTKQELYDNWYYLYYIHACDDFCGRTLEEAVESGLWAFYFGIIMRTLPEEVLCWLTQRGLNNGPVLLREVLKTEKMLLSSSCLHAQGNNAEPDS
jgi:hypothetical protein